MAVAPAPHPAEAQVKALREAYGVAETRLRALLNDAIASGNLARAEYLRMRRAEVVGILTELSSTAAPLSAQAVLDTYTVGSAQAARDLAGWLPKVKTNFSGIDRRAVALLQENATGKVTEVSTLIGRRVDDVLRKASLREMTQSIITAATPAQSAGAIERAIASSGVTITSEGNYRFLRIGGRNYNLADYAEMLARTTSREAQSHATANRCLQNDYDLVYIPEHAGGDDAACTDYVGQVWSLSGDTPGYDQLPEYPPFHPNCRHVLAPAPRSMTSA